MRNPFRRRREETRAIDTFAFGTDLTTGSASISQSRALGLAPVFGANRILASSVSTLPLKPYRKVGDERQPMNNLPQLFGQLQSDGQLVPWLHRCVTSLGLRGNAYGLITQRDGFGFPTAISWLNPSIVSADDSSGVPVWRVNGTIVPRGDIFHIPWFTLPGETIGLSPLGAFAVTMNLGLHAQEYGNDWFEAGGVPPGTFKNTAKTVDQDEARIIKGRLVSAIRTREPIVYGADWDYNAITLSPQDAQFVETNRLTATQVATIYGIPPEMIGGDSGRSMTYQNVEQQALNFVTFTLRPWLVALESAFSSILPDRQYVRFNADALVRADLKTRYEVYDIARRIGVRNVDDIRELEDLPPLPNGQGQQYAPVAAAPESSDSNVTPLRRWAEPR